MKLPGLGAPVEVRFDRIGIPHVRAATEEDAYRALGWLHAADRLFQMEARRRAAAGRLAELVGEGALRHDLESRRLGLARLARADLETLPPNLIRMLASYAEGVNAYVERQALPMEFLALGIVPEEWTPLDSVGFQWLMYWNLADAVRIERARLDLLEALGPDRAVAYLDAASEASTTVADELRALFARRPETKSGRREENPLAAGSNAWALAGRKTASGRPLLATDPHLPAENPGIWYAAHLETTTGLHVAGLTLPGLPGVVIGHNGRIAWGFTMHQADDADLFLEELDETEAGYRRGRRFHPIEARQERIRVRRGFLRSKADFEEVSVRVLATDHGPILETLPRGLGPPGGSGSLAVAVAWAPASARGSLEAFALANRARDRGEIEEAWSRYRGPAMNVCWASADGHVGVLVAGAVPRRRRGDGRLPVPGWTGEYDWQGLFLPGELPAVADPAEGFVATANDDWAAAGIELPYPGHFAGRERVERIREILREIQSARPLEMRALQSDVVSLYARRVVGAVGELELEDARAKRAQQILRDWDKSIERRGPARLFHEFLWELRERTFGPRERRYAVRLPVTWELLARMLEGSGGASLWDDPDTAEAETREQRVSTALSASLARLEEREGPDPSLWSWERVHAVSYEHPLFGKFGVGFLRRLGGAGPTGLPGDVHTVNVAGFALGTGSFDVRHIPSARLIVDLADPDQSRIVLPLGQSGQIGDRHRRDQLGPWSEGLDFPFPFSREAVERSTVSVLRLVP